MKKEPIAPGSSTMIPDEPVLIRADQVTPGLSAWAGGHAQRRVAQEPARVDCLDHRRIQPPGQGSNRGAGKANAATGEDYGSLGATESSSRVIELIFGQLEPAGLTLPGRKCFARLMVKRVGLTCEIKGDFDMNRTRPTAKAGVEGTVQRRNEVGGCFHPL